MPGFLLGQAWYLAGDGFADDVVVFQLNGAIFFGVSAGLFADLAHGIDMAAGILIPVARQNE
jgi:hypothetical protein